MIKIVLFALICVSSLSSIAKASSGFYISASSLRSQENASTTTSVAPSNVTYNSSMTGLSMVRPLSVPYKFASASNSNYTDLSTFNGYIDSSQTFILKTGILDIIETTGNVQLIKNIPVFLERELTYNITPVNFPQ